MCFKHWLIKQVLSGVNITISDELVESMVDKVREENDGEEGDGEVSVA